MKIHKLLIANRGEIAVRIIRAARELSIATVQVYSKADQDSLAVRLADECVDIGPPQASKSYLNRDAILAAAKTTGADAIHPGYGFLAENAEFAAAVEDAGLVFVGPTAQSIRLMGDKVAAREAAASAGVPTVPGSRGRLESGEAAFALVKTTGFPVMIKAAAGGRRPRHPHRAIGRGVSSPDAASAGRGARGLRRWRPLRRETDRRGTAHRSTGAGRRARCHPLLRARMLAAAPPPEGLGGSALTVV
jgi:pyruvate carboxylase